MDNPRELILVDATSFCYRAFYAIRGLSTSAGQATNAVYGFIMMIKKVLDMWSPEYMGICFDVSRDTFRTRKFKEYKENRPSMPDELSSQMSLIREVVRAYNFALVEKPGFEADDVIATLAKKASSEGFKVIIVATDKDILQLVGENIFVFNPYKDKGVLYSKDKVKENFGINPEQIPDFISLAGDAVDNIPSIKGIGEKIAVSLLTNYKDSDELINSIETLKESRVKDNIKENIEQLKLNKELAKLDSNVSLGLSIDDLKVQKPNYDKLYELFRKLEFKTLLKSIPISDNASNTQFSKDQKSLIDNLKSAPSVSLMVDNDNAVLYFSLNGDRVWMLEDVSIDLFSCLDRQNLLKITYDLKSTYKLFTRKHYDLKGPFFDCLLADYLLNPAKASYELSDIVFDCFGKRIDVVFGGIMYLQGIKDKLFNKLKENELSCILEDIETPLAKVLAKVEETGFAIDLEFLKELSSDFNKRLDKITKDIFALSGSEFNINSPKQLRVVLFDQLKLPVVKKTKTGPSTDEEVLKALAGKHELPALLLEYRQINKLKTTYVDALPALAGKLDSRIHCNFKQFGTETGRLSCENPNLQNIPVKTDLGKRIRRAFISSSSDSVLISSDYSQIELRILAHLSNDDNLIEAFRKDEDIHRFTASLVFGIPENDVDEHMRDTAKRVNFGIVYGISAFGLAKDLSISFPEAQNLIDTYFLRYPKVKDYIENQIKFARDNGYVSTILGRKRYILGINDPNVGQRQFAERQAMNTPVQGSAADLIKLAMIKISEEIEDKKLPLKMILQVHDELIFESTKDFTIKAVKLIKERMENVCSLKVPIKVDMKTGKNWLDMEKVKEDKS